MKNKHVIVYILLLSATFVKTASTEQLLLSISPATEVSYLAKIVAMDENSELAGMRWRGRSNNIPLPEVRIIMKNNDGVLTLDGAISVATTLVAQDTTWNEIYFDDAIQSEVGDLYIAVRFPEQAENDSTTEKSSIAYSISPYGNTISCIGNETWITSDGTDWIMLHGSVNVMIEPIYGAGKSLNCIVMKAPEQIIYTSTLLAPSPNPFNPATKIGFILSNNGHVDISVYNVRGAMIRKLIHEELLAGPHEVVWDGCDKFGREVASGLYFAKLRTALYTETKQMMLVR